MSSSENIGFWQKAATEATARVMLAPIVFSGASALEQNEFDHPPLVVVAEERPELPQKCFYPSYEAAEELRFDCNRPSIIKNVVIVDFGDSNDQLVQDIAVYSDRMIDDVMGGVVDINFEIVEASSQAKETYIAATNEHGCTDENPESRPSNLARTYMPELAGKNIIALSPLPSCNENLAGLGNHMTKEADVFNVQIHNEEYNGALASHVGRVSVHEAGHSVLALGHSGELSNDMYLETSINVDQILAESPTYHQYDGYSVMGGGEWADYPLLPEFFDCISEFKDMHDERNPLSANIYSQSETLSYAEAARGQYFSVGLDNVVELSAVDDPTDSSSAVTFSELNIVPSFEDGELIYELRLKSLWGCDLAQVGSLHIFGEDQGEVNFMANGENYSIIAEDQNITLTLADG
jgi:hypothetical protein